MAFPNKFRHLIELTEKEIDPLHHAWLTYAVCAIEEDSCGWQGWIIDGVFTKVDSAEIPISSFPSDTCPVCGKPLFRTAAELRLVPSEDQKRRLVPGVDYDVSEIEYS